MLPTADDAQTILRVGVTCSARTEVFLSSDLEAMLKELKSIADM